MLALASQWLVPYLFNVIRTKPIHAVGRRPCGTLLPVPGSRRRVAVEDKAHVVRNVLDVVAQRVVHEVVLVELVLHTDHVHALLQTDQTDGGGGGGVSGGGGGVRRGVLLRVLAWCCPPRCTGHHAAPHRAAPHRATPHRTAPRRAAAFNPSPENEFTEKVKNTQTLL